MIFSPPLFSFKIIFFAVICNRTISILKEQQTKNQPPVHPSLSPFPILSQAPSPIPLFFFSSSYSSQNPSSSKRMRGRTIVQKRGKARERKRSVQWRSKRQQKRCHSKKKKKKKQAEGKKKKKEHLGFEMITLKWRQKSERKCFVGPSRVKQRPET